MTQESSTKSDSEGRIARLDPTGASLAAKETAPLASSFSAQPAPMASRRSAPGGAATEDSSLQLLADAWKKIGGETVLDQSKAILAIVGILALFLLFWKMVSGAPEAAPQEE